MRPHGVGVCNSACRRERSARLSVLCLSEKHQNTPGQTDSAQAACRDARATFYATRLDRCACACVCDQTVQDRQTGQADRVETECVLVFAWSRSEVLGKVLVRVNIV